MGSDKIKEALEVYGCAESPLYYMIESKCTVDIVDKDEDITLEDLELILE